MGAVKQWWMDTVGGIPRYRTAEEQERFGRVADAKYRAYLKQAQDAQQEAEERPEDEAPKDTYNF